MTQPMKKAQPPAVGVEPEYQTNDSDIVSQNNLIENPQLKIVGGFEVEDRNSFNAELKRRGIAPDVASKLKLRHLDITEARSKYYGYSEGIEFPFFNIDGEPVLEADGQPYCHARLFTVKNGKYRSQRGDRPHAYLPPLLDWRAVANDIDFAICITEGEFKAIRNSTNIPTIGLTGVDMLQDGNLLVPELRRFKWKDTNGRGRKVFIVFDAPHKDEIHRAAWKAQCVLEAHGATVEVLDIVATPEYQNASTGFAELPKMGLDDYLDAGGEWATLLKHMLDLTTVFGDDKNKDLAWMLSNVAYLRAGKGDQYIVMDDTFRVVDGKPVRTSVGIKADFAPLCFKNPSGRGYTQVFDLWQRHSKRLVCDSISFNPAKPEWALYQSGSAWIFNDWRGLAVSPRANPEVETVIRAFVRSMFSGWDPTAGAVIQTDEQALLERWFWNFFANMFQHPDRRPTHAWSVSGDGGIGKSVLMEMPIAIIGPTGSSTISPDDLFDKYQDALYGKWYLVANEPSSNFERHTAMMKALRTNEELTINIKFGAKFAVTNTLIINATTNKDFTYGMDKGSRRDLVLSPKWLTEGTALELPEGPEREAHLAHHALAVEVGKRLGVTAKGPEREVWAAAYLAMLLDHKIDSDYSHAAAAPKTQAQDAMSQASHSAIDLAWQEVWTDVLNLAEDNGGVLFTAKSWKEWLIEQHYRIAPEVAKQRFTAAAQRLPEGFDALGFNSKKDDGKIRKTSLYARSSSGVDTDEIKGHERVFGLLKPEFHSTEGKCRLLIPPNELKGYHKNKLDAFVLSK